MSASVSRALIGPCAPGDDRSLPLLLVSIPLILIAGFVLVSFVPWTTPWAGK